jgi:4-amino-4-deoxy-L-arabinose transferase-like glycosyltransferase
MEAPERVNAAPSGRPRDPAAARHLAFLLLAGAVLFLWKLGSHDLWPPDEPRFALVAREMRSRGDYSVLSLNDRLYTDKPPLFFWAINAAALLRGGVDEWAARLPSAVAGIGALLLVYLLGARLYDRRAAIFGALVFATALQIAERARWASIDMTLNLFVLGAIALLSRSRDRPDDGAWGVRGAWVLMGLATLAKGPVGLVLPLLAVVPAWLLEKDARAVRRILAPSGIALYLLTTLAWFGRFAHRIGIVDALHVLMRQNVERYLDAWNAQHPVWYYLWRFPAGFLPWTLLLPWAIVHAWREPEPGARRAGRFLLAWMGAVLLFFSFSTGKRGVYVIPIYPAAALLAGRLLASATRRTLSAPALLWTLAALALAALVPEAAGRRDPSLAPMGAAIAGVFLAGGASALAALLVGHRGRRHGAAVGPDAAHPATAVPAAARAAAAHPAAAWCLVGSAALVLLIAVAGLVPLINRFQNIRRFAEQVRPHLEDGVPFGTTEQKREAWVFYTGRFAEVLDTRASLLTYLAGPPPRDLLIEEEVLREIRAELPPGVAEVVRGRVGGSAYCLLRREAGS